VSRAPSNSSFFNNVFLDTPDKQMTRPLKVKKRAMDRAAPVGPSEFFISLCIRRAVQRLNKADTCSSHEAPIHALPPPLSRLPDLPLHSPCPLLRPPQRNQPLQPGPGQFDLLIGAPSHHAELLRPLPCANHLPSPSCPAHHPFIRHSFPSLLALFISQLGDPSRARPVRRVRPVRASRPVPAGISTSHPWLWRLPPSPSPPRRICKRISRRIQTSPRIAYHPYSGTLESGQTARNGRTPSPPPAQASPAIALILRPPPLRRPFHARQEATALPSSPKFHPGRYPAFLRGRA
jgi:hypothetical protein